jgi:uncharacterized protein (DUF169 family)
LDTALWSPACSTVNAGSGGRPGGFHPFIGSQIQPGKRNDRNPCQGESERIAVQIIMMRERRPSMPANEAYAAWAEELRACLFLETHPVAVATLANETEMPAGALRPVRDLGGHMSLCQGFALSRREGKTVAFLKTDHWCYVPVVAFGQAQPPQTILDGDLDYPERIQSLEAAKRVARERIHLDYGACAGIVSAPLKSAPFAPELVMIYCNPSQLRVLLMALRYREGETVTTTLEPGAACVNSTVPVIRDRKCQVTIPCMGDRQRALAGEDEMIFSAPIEKFEQLLEGVRHIAAIGAISVKPFMRLDHPMGEKYRQVGRAIGLEM